MRAGDASVEPKPLGLADQRLDVAGERIVGLVAMQIDPQSARGGDLAQRPHRGGAVGHGALEMRNAADDLDAAIERPLEISPPPWASENSRPAERRRAGGRDRAQPCV